ncbi:MAG: hypothetical protein DMG55_16775 [Acidobacteria bacterium]|nr:MAG: hypothetical protein DMG55_16775 [Acidobacteriota bacterium]
MFFCFFFIEFGVTDNRIGLRFFLCLFVLSLDETRSECGDLIFIQISVIPGGFHIVSRRFDHCAASSGSLLGGISSFSRRRCFGFSSGTGKEPAGQPAGEPAGSTAAARSGGREIASRARSNFLDRGLLLSCLVLNNGGRCGRNCRLATILCQRLAR